MNMTKEQLVQELMQMKESSSKLGQEYQEEAVRYVTECSTELGKRFHETAESFQHEARNLCVQEANEVHGRMVNKMNQQLCQQERGHEFKINTLERQVEQTMEEQKNLILQETNEAHSRQQQRLVFEARAAITSAEQRNQEALTLADRKVLHTEEQASVLCNQAMQLNMRLEQLQPQNDRLSSETHELQEEVTMYEESRREIEAKTNYLSDEVLQQLRKEERMKQEFETAYETECRSVQMYKSHFANQEQLNEQLQR